MDRETYHQQLEVADRQIERAEGNIARQRKIIEGLKGLGQDAAAAEALLRAFEDALAPQLAHREGIRRELGSQD